MSALSLRQVASFPHIFRFGLLVYDRIDSRGVGRFSLGGPSRLEWIICHLVCLFNSATLLSAIEHLTHHFIIAWSDHEELGNSPAAPIGLM